MGYGPEAIAKAEQVIELVAGDWTLGKACKCIGISTHTFSEVLRGVRDLARSYAQVREIQADTEADEAKEIADAPCADAQVQKNRIEIRKWRASKFNSKVFGDRVELNVSQNISVRGALDEAKSRVLPLFTPNLPTIDVEVISPKDPEIPDIFS